MPSVPVPPPFPIRSEIRPDGVVPGVADNEQGLSH